MTHPISHGPLPLVVGVTGHRDLRPEDVPALEALVRATLTGVQERYPATPLRLLSPLAEGSDRLVARVAREAGVRFVVPLPLPQALYEEDFETEASRAEFRELLAAAAHVYELPLVEGNTPEGLREPGDQRDRQYAQVGAFIARHSQVFLALWDGREGAGFDKTGGTSEIVRLRLEDASTSDEPSAGLLGRTTSGPVYHIVTPRRSAPAPEHALTCRLLLPMHQAGATLEELYGWMNRFNEDALAHRHVLDQTLAGSRAALLADSPAERDAMSGWMSPSARETLEHYGVADSLALHFGARMHQAQRRLVVWVFGAALCFNLFHSLPHPHVPEDASLAERLVAVPWLLLAFLAASWIASHWVHRPAGRADYQNRYQDYRALAEALRIQFFWRVAGIDDPVVDHYLNKQRGALEWIRSALLAWDAVEPGHRRSADVPEAARPKLLALVAQRWVTEQRRYYTARAGREHAALENEKRRIRWLVRLSVGTGLALALILTVPLLVPSPPLEALRRWVEGPWVHGLMKAAIVTFAVIAGLWHGYNQQMARSEHAKQFDRMGGLFAGAERRLTSLLEAGAYDRALALLEAVGREALEENADWVLLHRERPLEVPHSG